MNTIEKNDLFVEQMPFFEALYGRGKAVIDIAAFEKWFREFQNYEAFEQGREHTFRESKRDESSDGWDDDPFFSDIETFDGPVPHDLSENHDKYLYGEK